MPNGDLINKELEFREHYNHMSPDERNYWVSKEIWFQSQSIKKLSECQEDRKTRVQRVETAIGIDSDSPKPQRKISPGIKYTAYGLGGTVGCGTVIYWIIEALKEALGG